MLFGTTFAVEVQSQQLRHDIVSICAAEGNQITTNQSQQFQAEQQWCQTRQQLASFCKRISTESSILGVFVRRRSDVNNNISCSNRYLATWSPTQSRFCWCFEKTESRCLRNGCHSKACVRLLSYSILKCYVLSQTVNWFCKSYVAIIL